MDILSFIINNESELLLILSIILALISKYYSNQAQVLYAAGQAIVDLQQTFLGDIADGVITKAEMDDLLVKIAAAKTAVLAVVTIFTQPQTIAQKISILLGTSGANQIIAGLRQKTAMLQATKKHPVIKR